MSVRTVLITLNVVALVALGAFIAFRILSLRRNPTLTEPLNIRPYLDDEALEGPKLERALGAALFFFFVIAAALPLYWVFLPSRDADATRYFDKQAAERGAVYFANAESPQYDSTQSLLCANCHGLNGQGGAAPFVMQSEDPTCQPGETRRACLPIQVSWRAPALDTVFGRFSDEEVRQIIVWGRPGTPMPAWGVESGKGILNAQGISDIMAFLKSIQVSSAEAKAVEAKAPADLRTEADGFVKAAQDNVAKAQQALAAATTADARATATRSLSDAQLALQNSLAYQQQISTASQGELLFMAECARCHTKYWSSRDPSNPRVPLPAAPGTGAFGPNISGGDTLRQFPGASGQVDFVTKGSDFQQPYGVRGIGSGRMPGFSNQLTDAQIKAIVDYERTL